MRYYPVKANDGAFPVPDPYEELGLTKREYFAALALQGLLAHGNTLDEATEWAVYAADYLIEALNDNPGEGQQ